MNIILDSKLYTALISLIKTDVYFSDCFGREKTNYVAELHKTNLKI